MHPAYSVILFTCASGAGYGLLVWLALWSLVGAADALPVFYAVSLMLALALIMVGRVSSTFHLGRPARAWRALSQWRTSWLSREGVLALATFVPAGVLGLEWIFHRDLGFDWVEPAAVTLTVLGAAATVWCTGMIYASLPTIRAWHHPLVAPIYVVLALATGGVIGGLLLALFGLPPQIAALVSLPVLVLGWALKGAYWSSIDAGGSSQTLATATGLGSLPGASGHVRTLDPPHTQANYVMREMGYTIARRHAEKLRRIAMLSLFLAPALTLLALLGIGHGPLDLPLAAVAALSVIVGVLTERWLFFAEARHISMLYYGADGA